MNNKFCFSNDKFEYAVCLSYVTESIRGKYWHIEFFMKDKDNNERMSYYGPYEQAPLQLDIKEYCDRFLALSAFW